MARSSVFWVSDVGAAADTVLSAADEHHCPADFVRAVQDRLTREMPKEVTEWSKVEKT